MAYRDTGPGYIEIDQRYSGAGILKALLYNFDFDDSHIRNLKKEHTGFLVSSALPLLRGDRGAIMLLGRASRIGANAYNMGLSRRRVDRVADFLAASGVSAQRIRRDAVGEENSVSTLADDPRDRSVEFVILPLAIPEPTPRRVPPPPAVARRFRLRLLGDIGLSGVPRRLPRGSLGAGAAAVAQIFEIEDTENGLSAFYGYSGIGIGAGFEGLFLSATDAGPWNEFTTSAPMNVGDFGGFSRFTTAGAGNATLNYLYMAGTPAGVDPVYLEINTGTTYGAGANSTIGPLQRIAGPMPTGERDSH